MRASPPCLSMHQGDDAPADGPAVAQGAAETKTKGGPALQDGPSFSGSSWDATTPSGGHAGDEVLIDTPKTAQGTPRARAADAEFVGPAPTKFRAKKAPEAAEDPPPSGADMAPEKQVHGPFCFVARKRGGGGLAQGHGVGLSAFGGAYWPLALAHSDPLWVRTCFGCVNGAPG